MFKVEWNRKFTTISVYAFIVIVASILFFYAVNNFAVAGNLLLSTINPIRPIFYGLILAYLFNPILNMYESKVIPFLARNKKLKQKTVRTFGLLLTYFTTIIVFIGFLMIIVPQVAVSIYGIASQLPSYVSLAETFVNELFAKIPEGVIPPEYINKVITMVGDTVEALFGVLTAMIPAVFSFTVGVTSGVFRMIMAFIVSIYVLSTKEKFFSQSKKLLYAFLSSPTVGTILSVTRTTHRMFGGFIIGKLIDSLIIGVICFISLSIMNMPNVVLVSFIVGLTNIIPFFGPFFGAVPCFLIIFIDAPMQAYLFIAFIIILQQIDGNIIGPMILGDSTGLSAFWVIFSILLFGGLFGVPGMIIGVPTFGVLYWVLQEIIILKLERKGMPTETDAYLDYHPKRLEKK